jgi:hypothetical protein
VVAGERRGWTLEERRWLARGEEVWPATDGSGRRVRVADEGRERRG